MNRGSDSQAGRPVLAGIFCISCAALMFEISLTRLLAISYWHHFAFLIISCALLGYGSAGSWLAVFRKPAAPYFQALLFTVGLIPIYSLSAVIPFDPARLPLESIQWVYLVIVFIALSLPFFFCGTTINLIFRQYPGDSFRVYSSDLLGAAAGCVLAFIVIPVFNETQWLLVVSMLGVMSALLLINSRTQAAFIIGLSSATALFILLTGLPAHKISPYKSLPTALRYPGSTVLQSRWDAVSRVDWLKSPLVRFAPGLSLNYRDRLPEQTGITIDADSLTAFTEWDDATNRFIESLPSWILYQLEPEPDSALILQAVGGLEINVARHAGIHSIAAQAGNRLTGDWLSQQPKMGRVDVTIEKARTFLARSNRKYDRIAMSLEGALPTGETGMSALQESHLMTVQGISEVLSHLSDHGWLAIHRYLLPPPRAEIRLLATIIKAARLAGWPPEKRIGVFRSVSTITIIVSATDWHERDRQDFRHFCAALGYAPVYYPGMNPDEANRINRFAEPIYARAVSSLLADPESFHASSIFNLKPVTDNRPFFYFFLRFEYIDRIYRIMDRKWEGLIEAGLLLPVMLAGISLIAFLLILWPVLTVSRQEHQFSCGHLFFLMIGFGFMAVEITFIEKLILLLGEPGYSFAVVLGSLLLFSGLGSGLARYFRWSSSLLPAGIISLLVCYAFLLTTFVQTLIGYPFLIRLFAAVLLIAIPGFLMGIPFPMGIRALAEQDRKLSSRDDTNLLQKRVSLAWCLNSFSSVIGAVGAMLIAQILGFSVLLLTAGFLYLLAFLFFEKIK